MGRPFRKIISEDPSLLMRKDLSAHSRMNHVVAENRAARVPRQIGSGTGRLSQDVSSFTRPRGHAVTEWVKKRRVADAFRACSKIKVHFNR
jgi:hypothetical protein